ncbi:MAG: glycoside hydrolase family 88 protein [Anaeroplasmataceae bacterium]|nr:glycoside hydrolase family 88 protein [Anaeroplasmataceae bacterium]
MKEIQIIENYISKLIQTSTPLNPMWNVEIQKGRAPSWNYIDGCMLKAILELYELRKNTSYLNFIIQYTDYFVLDSGLIQTYNPLEYSLDNLSESSILFDLWKYTKNEKYSKAIDYTYTQIQSQPRTYEGNFWHKPRHPNQVWLDGLYMAQIFYMRYETIFNQNKNYPDIRHQYELVRNHMFNKEKQLYYHGYDASKEAFWCNKETGCSKGYWLRALGWYITSLVELMADMDQKHPDYLFYSSLFKEAIDGILLYQDKDSKMFYQVVDQVNRPGNYLETSGSAMISYSILKATRLGILSKKYRTIGLEIFDGICNKYLKVENGEIHLGGICLLAGLGNALFRDGSFEHYIQEEIVEDDAKGVAPFLLAYIERLKI